MLLGIDIGTSSLKIAIYTTEGCLLYLHKVAYTPDFPQPGWAEINPLIWFEALHTALSSCPAELKSAVKALSFSGQMHGVVACDQHATPLFPAILWLDQRAHTQLTLIPSDLLNSHGNTPYLGAMGLSILWLKTHHPEIVKKTHSFLSPKDWLRAYLTADFATEASDATATLLTERSGLWDRALLDHLDINPKQLPCMHTSMTETSPLLSHHAHDLGLAKTVRVFIGGADTACAALAAGFITEHHTLLTTGTGAQLVTTHILPPPPQTSLNLFAMPTPQHGIIWYQMAAMLNCGSVFEWARQHFQLSWEAMYAEAFCYQHAHREVDVEADPWLNGERTPWMNPNLSAGWRGIKAHHTRGDLIYALFRSVALSIKVGLESFPHHLTIAAIDFAGGGSTHPLWRQMIANALNKPLNCLDEVNLSVKGAALLAGLGAQLLHIDSQHNAFAPKQSATIYPQTEAAAAFAVHKSKLMEQMT